MVLTLKAVLWGPSFGPKFCLSPLRHDGTKNRKSGSWEVLLGIWVRQPARTQPVVKRMSVKPYWEGGRGGRESREPRLWESWVCLDYGDSRYRYYGYWKHGIFSCIFLCICLRASLWGLLLVASSYEIYFLVGKVGMAVYARFKKWRKKKTNQKNANVTDPFDPLIGPLGLDFSHTLPIIDMAWLDRLGWSDNPSSPLL